CPTTSGSGRSGPSTTSGWRVPGLRPGPAGRAGRAGRAGWGGPGGGGGGGGWAGRGGRAGRCGKPTCSPALISQERLTGIAAYVALFLFGVLQALIGVFQYSRGPA